MGSTYKRSFIKGFSWEFFSFIITFIAVYLAFGNFKISLGFSLILSLIKASIFFVHERIWKTIKWGKIKD
jgi:adenylylsulfate kinase